MSRSLTVTQDETTIEIDGGWYRLRAARARHRVGLLSPDGDLWLSLSLIASADRADRSDESHQLNPLHVDRVDDDLVRLSARAHTAAWDEHVVELDCRADALRLRLRLVGSGRLRDVTLAGGVAVLASGAAGTFRSGGAHDTVFSPAPSEPIAPLRDASAALQLGVVGDAEPGRLHGLFSPPPLVFGLGRTRREPAMPWLGVGLVAPIARCTFTSMRYEPLDGGFLVRLAYEEHTAVDGEWTSPELSIRPAASAPDVIDGLRHGLIEAGLAPEAPFTPDWALEPLFCGWGAQCAAAVRGRTSEAADAGLVLPAGASRAPDLARHDLYDRWLSHLSGHGVVPGTIVIDDRWQAKYGTNTPDESKWPDLRAWIAERHRDGQRVLLWFKAWDPEGLPAEVCIRDAAGRAVAVDPGNPAYLEELRRQVRFMLAPEGLDADGFKVDFTQRAPSGATLTSAADGVDPVWGIAGLHALLSTIVAAARETKPEAAIITHAVDPRFGDVSHVVRLNDVLERDSLGTPVPVVEQLRFRADVVARSLPNHVIDTDQWPMPNRDEWREYSEAQGDLGVPALYYVESIDNSDEDITADDLRDVAAQWAAYRARVTP